MAEAKTTEKEQCERGLQLQLCLRLRVGQPSRELAVRQPGQHPPGERRVSAAPFGAMLSTFGQRNPLADDARLSEFAGLPKLIESDSGKVKHFSGFARHIPYRIRSGLRKITQRWHFFRHASLGS